MTEGGRQWGVSVRLASAACACCWTLSVPACSNNNSGSSRDGGGGSSGATSRGSSGATSGVSSGGDTADAGGTDSASQLCPDTGRAPTASWTPLSLGSGLAVWLDGSRAVTQVAGKVTRWGDQSSNHNDATQSAVANQPNYVAIQNAQCAVGFSSPQDMYITDSPSLDWGQEDYLVEVVVSYTNLASKNDYGGYAALYIKYLSPPPYTGPGLFANNAFTGASDVYAQVQDSVNPAVPVPMNVYAAGATTGLNTGALHLLAMRRMGATATLEVRLDGAVDGQTNTLQSVDVSSPGNRVWIGGQQLDGTQALAGSIAEIVAYHGTIAPSNLDQLESYLLGRYSISRHP